MENTDEGHDNQEWREFEAKDESFLEEEKKKNQTSGPVEHAIYEEKPVRKKIRLEYVKSIDSLEKADQEIVELQGVVESTLYCECGDVFKSWEAAVNHMREFCT